LTHQNPQPEYFTARIAFRKDPNAGNTIGGGSEIYPQIAFNEEIRIYGVRVAGYVQPGAKQITYADLATILTGTLELDIFVGGNQIPFQSINASDLILSKNHEIYFSSPAIVEMKQPLRIDGGITPPAGGKAGLKERFSLVVTLICERHLKEN